MERCACVSHARLLRQAALKNRRPCVARTRRTKRRRLGRESHLAEDRLPRRLRRDGRGAGRLVRLRAVRVGGIQLDVLLPARAGGRAARHPRGAPRQAGRSRRRARVEAHARLEVAGRMMRRATAADRDPAAHRSWMSRRDGRRRILVDARTPVNFTMVAPVVSRSLRTDPRVQILLHGERRAHADGRDLREARRRPA